MYVGKRLMKGRPHTSPECRCAACVKYDREQEEQWSPYCDFRFADLAWHRSAAEAESAAWQALISVCDAVFADDIK